MKKFISLTFVFLFFMLSSVCYSEVKMNLKWQPHMLLGELGVISYSIQNRGDPVTITGYKLNRGNTKSIEQEQAKGNFKFEPKTLKFGESIYLFSVGKDLVEVEVMTDDGPVKFEFD